MTRSSRILVIGPSWVGDMVMTQSLFKLLKAQNPQVVIDVVAPAWSLPVLARMPEVDKAIVLDVPHRALGLLQRLKLAKVLRNNQYDQAIVIPRSYKSALLPWLAGIRKRTGWIGEYRYLLLNDIRKLDKTVYPKMVQRMVALGLPKSTKLTDFAYPALSVQPQHMAETLKRFAPQRNSQSVLVLCPGAEFGSAKRWIDAHYAEVARYYHAQNWQVWILGSTNDKPIANAIQTLSGSICHNFTGVTSLTESIDLLSQASVVVSNDSGLMHIAASLNRPLVALFGSTSSSCYAPLSNQAEILSVALSCSPCGKRTCPLSHHACMENLKPAMVIQAITRLLLKSAEDELRSIPNPAEFA